MSKMLQQKVGRLYIFGLNIFLHLFGMWNIKWHWENLVEMIKEQKESRKENKKLDKGSVPTIVIHFQISGICSLLLQNISMVCYHMRFPKVDA